LCNAKKLAKEQFMEQAVRKHDEGGYGYDKVDYVNNQMPGGTIICNTCKKDFKQTPGNYLSGNGCPVCGIKSGSLTKKQFIERAIKKHGEGKYSYDKVDYVNSYTPVTIICNTCKKEFEQRPGNHLNGSGCPVCRIISQAKSRSLTKEQFIERAIGKHGEGKYGYDKVDYVNGQTPITITCNTCGEDFEQIPSNHLNGSGCPKCNYSKGGRGNKAKLKMNLFQMWKVPQ
jgi:Zn finger protein HypA/HybF involved in hydrogenase expression